MRIALVYDALVPYRSGGAERRYHELAIRLAADHEVHYVTWRYWGADERMVRDGITYHGIGAPREFYGEDGRRTIREMAAFAWRLPATLARMDVDVVDISATPYLPVFGAWLATRRTRTPLVATWHEYWGEHWRTYLPDRPVVARIAQAAEALARPFSDRRVAVSEFTARRMHGGAAHGSVGWSADVVGNGVDLDRLARPTRARDIDVLFVGRLIAEKRVDLLLDSVAALAREAGPLRCLIVGDGPERDRLTTLVGELGITDEVTFAGRVADEEIPTLMNRARVLVLPSSREGYGITVVEAQACGAVPIVVDSPLSAATELVRHGEDGLIAHASVPGIAGCIRELLADPERLARMSTAARRSGLARGWDDRASDMERIYANVVAERGGKRRGRTVPTLSDAASERRGSPAA